MVLWTASIKSLDITLGICPNEFKALINIDNCFILLIYICFNYSGVKLS